MLPLAASVLEKVDHAYDRIQAVKSSCGALHDTEAALDALAEKLTGYRPRLLDFIKIPQSPEVMGNYCDIVLADLFRLLPYVGFLHRSRNASNPFEVHGPLKRLANEFIDEDVRLIISNEWEFSPYTHSSMIGIKGFVLLGLPASEAADNVLLVPIAGHEFGHSVWKRQGLEAAIDADLEREVHDQMRLRLGDLKTELGLLTEEDLKTERALLARDDLKDRALAQCEEIFCDFCGLLVFGESYCHAFAHLLAPGLINSHDSSYPSAIDRAEYLIEAGTRFGISVPSDFGSVFVHPYAGDLWSQIVGGAVDEVLEELMDAASRYAAERKVRPPSTEGIQSSVKQLELGRPVQFTSTLPEVLCAAWQLRLDAGLWKSIPQWYERNYQMLNELVLKSAESIEYWARVEAISRAK